MKNNVIELQSEINFCPYCGKGNDYLETDGEDSLLCDNCGKEFTVMTHE